MHKYGLRGPDKTDLRDFRLAFSPKLKLPAAIDLRGKCPAIMDQGELGSCVANALCGMMQFNDKEGDNIYTPLSRLMLYYLARCLDGNIEEDCGTYARTAIKCLARFGTAKEALWPYSIEKFAEAPGSDSYEDAFKRRIIIYQRIITLFDMLACLAAGKPFVLGIPVYESFESDAVARTGAVPMPRKWEMVLGYHEIYCCGYDNKKARVTCANSWGTEWGDDGFCTLPYDYLKKYVVPEGKGDCWTVQKQLLPEEL